MTASDDPVDNQAAEQQQYVGGDKIAIEKVAGGAVAVGRGATAVYQGLSYDEVLALFNELKDESQPTVWDGRIPYLGLKAFQEEDAQFFFGREALVSDLLGRVEEDNRFIVIAGPSGSGKSSVARAGLFHALRRGRVEGSEKWVLATMSPKDMPIENMALALGRDGRDRAAARVIREEGQTNSLALLEQVALLQAMSDDPHRRFVLLVDQFEELFTQTKDEATRAAFINLLTSATGSNEGRTIIVLSLRSDFLSNCALYPELREQINKTNQFRLVGAMEPPDLAKAITLPALAVGAVIDPALVKQIIDDMKGEPGALPLMSFALRDLFSVQKNVKGQPVELTREEYMAHGGIESALERHADRVFQSFSAEQKEVAKNVFSGLIEVGQGRMDTRRTAVFEELVPSGVNQTEVALVISRLADEDARLLITGSGEGQEMRQNEASSAATVTIAHEKLIDAWPWLRRLVDENREIIALQNQINDDAQAWARENDAGYLYRSGRLMHVEERLDLLQPNLNALSRRFIEASLAQQAKERRQARRNVAIFISLLAILLAGSLFAALLFSRQATENEHIAATAQAESTRAFLGEQTAARERDIALARQLAAQSQLHLDGSLDTALLLAVGATQREVTVEGRHSLIQALTRNPRSMTFLHGHTGIVNSLAVSPAGQLIAAAGCDQRNSAEVCERGVINIWDSTSRRSVGMPITGHQSDIRSIAFSPDGALLASGGEDSHVILWDVATQQIIGSPLAGYDVPTNSLAFSPNGDMLATTSGSNIVVWDMKNFQPREFSAATSTDDIKSVAFSPNGELVAAGGFGGQIHIWRVATGQLERAIFLDPETRESFDHAVWAVAFSPNGQTLASGGCATVGARGCSGGEIRNWDVNSGEEKSAPIITPNGVFDIAYSPDGRHLASGSCAELVQPWCFLSETRIWTIDHNGSISPYEYEQESLRAGEGFTTEVAFSPDGKTLYTGGEAGVIAGWDIANRPLHHELKWEEGDKVTSVLFSPDGRTLATADQAGQITLWDFANNQLVVRIPSQHTMAVRSLAYSPDGKLIMSAGDDGLVLLWDVISGEPAGRLLSKDQDEITSVAFSPDGAIQAAGSCGVYDADGVCIKGVIKTWRNEASPRILEGHEGLVRSIAFTPDGHILASAGSDGTVIFWDSTTGQKFHDALQADDQALNSIAFSPDGKLLVTAGESRLIKFWDVATLEAVGQPLEGHINSVDTIAFSPDGQTLASGACDFPRTICSMGETYLWDVESQTMIGENLDMLDRVSSVVFSPDGLTLATAGEFGEVDLWSVDLSNWQDLACSLANRTLSEDEWEQYVGTEIAYQETCPQFRQN